MVAFTKHFRHYLLGHRFLLRTDHGSLSWLRNFKEPSGQLARWLEQLQDFDFDIQHRSGSNRVNADSMSRLPCNQCGRPNHLPGEKAVGNEEPTAQEISVTNLLPLGESHQYLHDLQMKDPNIEPILEAKEKEALK